METITYSCDRCRTRIEPHERGRLQWTAGPRRHDHPADLCPTCAAGFVAWLGGSLGASTEDRAGVVPSGPIPARP